jgi:hypothetical protein
MGGDSRTRQKRLARKATKRKPAAGGKRAFGRRTQSLDASRLAVMPIRECLVPATLFEQGIGNLLISRDLPGGRIAVGFFLVDVYCLGVKNAGFVEVWPEEYGESIRRMNETEPLESWDPACAVKLVREAVAYAKGLGLQPHPEYRKVARIIGDIDPGHCPRTFEFGEDGKPFYVQGPNETALDANRVMKTLTQRLGPDGFHYLLVLSADEMSDEMLKKSWKQEGVEPLR